MFYCVSYCVFYCLLSCAKIVSLGKDDEFLKREFILRITELHLKWFPTLSNLLLFAELKLCLMFWVQQSCTYRILLGELSDRGRKSFNFILALIEGFQETLLIIMIIPFTMIFQPIIIIAWKLKSSLENSYIWILHFP